MIISKIKKLRLLTGMSVSKCHKSLIINNNCVNKSLSWLKKNNTYNIKCKKNHYVFEGVIIYKKELKRSTIIELNCDSDFVSLNEKFIKLAEKLIYILHDLPYTLIKNLLKDKNEQLKISNVISKYILIFDEKIILKRMNKIFINNGIIIPYLHNRCNIYSGEIITLLAIEGNIDKNIKNFGKILSIHITAYNPLSISINDINENIIKNEKETFKKLVNSSNKKIKIDNKMIGNKINFFLKKFVLLNQILLDNKKTYINKKINLLKKQENFKIKSFIRYKVNDKLYNNI